MPIHENLHRQVLLPNLHRVLGIHPWTLNLSTGLLRVEYGREFEEMHLVELTIEQLAALLGPADMRLYRDHWDAAVRNRYHGPISLPFANAAGETSIVESACALFLNGTERYLVGVFKRVSQKAELGRNARLLTEFLESFIANSPSGIVVVDHQGKVVTANREFIRFVGKSERKEVLQAQALDMVYEVSPGLGQVMRDALRAPEPTRGRYEVTYRNGLRQTLYWRSYPLAKDEAASQPHVFAFDLNENGARSVAA